MIPTGLIAVLAAALVATGCGNGAEIAARTTRASAAPSKGQLLAGARSAVRGYDALSKRVLWTNTVPAHPRQVAGPALANLKSSALGRRKRGIRIRLLSARLRIIAAKLNPGYTRATVTIEARETVAPSNTHGKRLGHPITTNERARLLLHRLGHSNRFVVWQITALK